MAAEVPCRKLNSTQRKCLAVGLDCRYERTDFIGAQLVNQRRLSRIIQANYDDSGLFIFQAKYLQYGIKPSKEKTHFRLAEPARRPR